jgi:hypothetical protein
MEALGRRGVYLLLIHDLRTRWGEWSASSPGCALPPGRGPPGTHWTGGWVDPRAGLDNEARGKILSPLRGIEPRSPGRPVRSQTLYWLSYPGSHLLRYGLYITLLFNRSSGFKLLNLDSSRETIIVTIYVTGESIIGHSVTWKCACLVPK